MATPRAIGPFINGIRAGRRQMPRLVTELGVEKQCRKCRDFWTLDQFRRAKNCRDGLSDECRACYSDRRRRYRARAA